MLRSVIGTAFRRPSPAPRFSSNGGRGSPGCSETRRKMCSDGTDGSEWNGDIRSSMAYFYEKPPWKWSEVLFGTIAAICMATYKCKVRGATFLGYRPEDTKEEEEEVKVDKIDISLC